MSSKGFKCVEWDVFDLHPNHASYEIAPKQKPLKLNGNVYVLGSVATIYNIDKSSMMNASLIKSAPKMYKELEKVSKTLGNDYKGLAGSVNNLLNEVNSEMKNYDKEAQEWVNGPGISFEAESNVDTKTGMPVFILLTIVFLAFIVFAPLILK